MLLWKIIQDGHLTQVEIYEMLGLMSHVAAKVSPNDAVPGWVIFLVKLLDIFFYVVLFQGLCGTLHSVLLHVLRHVGIFDHCLPFRHGCSGKHKTQRRIHHLHKAHWHTQTHNPIDSCP
uniref:Uncharacterized protein n=1 Tax=Sparus aurata TaxID=8175 RepID=A0A671YIX4_SPAAU